MSNLKSLQTTYKPNYRQKDKETINYLITVAYHSGICFASVEWRILMKFLIKILKKIMEQSLKPLTSFMITLQDFSMNIINLRVAEAYVGQNNKNYYSHPPMSTQKK